MAEENNEPDEIDEQDEGCDDLCDENVKLEEDEVTGDEELPPATGGVEE